MDTRVTIADLVAAKAANRRIVAVSCYDYTTARLAAQVMLGFDSTLPAMMDFMPVCFSEVPNIKRITTNGFELALSVIFWSGIQHYGETPEGMARVPDYVKDFMREIPSYWDDTHFIEGFPGKHMVVARRFENKWYVAGISGENVEKSINLELAFPPQGPATQTAGKRRTSLKNIKTGMLITDGADNRSFDMQNIMITPGKPLGIKLKGNGGFVIKVEN